ncbi:MAG: hypothetical protein ABSH15_01635 [Verrucomicrobiota bacterium]|jgi:hypothetical protein
MKHPRILNPKDSILEEIFVAYKKAGELYKKETDPKTKQALHDMKRCFDLCIQRLSPLDPTSEKCWEELMKRFSN